MNNSGRSIANLLWWPLLMDFYFVCAATEVSKPFSWAAMASKNTAPTGAIPTVTSQTAVVKPQPAVKPEVKTDMSPNQPQPQRAPR